MRYCWPMNSSRILQGRKPVTRSKGLASVIPIEVSDPDGPTHVKPIRTRFDMGAEAKVKKEGRFIRHFFDYARSWGG